MPFLLTSYIVSQILAPLYASLLVISGVLLLVNLIPVLEIIIDYHIDFADFIRLYLYLSPQLLLFAIPMASMMGVTLGFTRLTNDNEIMVFKASGTSLYRLLPAVLIVAICTAALTALFSTHLIPAGTRALDSLLYRLARDKVTHGLQEQRFSQNLGDVVLYADRIDPASRVWHGVYVSDLRDPEVPVLVFAGSGQLSTRDRNQSISIELRDGSLHRASGETTQTIQFERYALQLPLSTAGARPPIKLGKNIMTMAELKSRAELHGVNTRKGADLLREFHKRLVLPFSCFIFSLLGFPLGLLAGPGRRAIGIPSGIVIFVLYYVLLTASEAMGESLVMPVAVAMWLPNALFFALTVVLVRGAGRETTALAADRLLELLHRVFTRIRRLFGGGR